jgi:alpha-L-arabinofuranosidase
MESGKWYKFRIEFNGNNDLICYINDEKVLEQEVHPLNKIHAVSGYDKESGETIVKFVNGTNEPYTTNIALNCAEVSPKGTIITLSTDIPADENSYENPDKIVPVTSEYSRFSKDFQYTFAPNSFTIMRIKTSDN